MVFSTCHMQLLCGLIAIHHMAAEQLRSPLATHYQRRKAATFSYPQQGNRGHLLVSARKSGGKWVLKGPHVSNLGLIAQSWNSGMAH